MGIYWTAAQIPELTSLTPDQRRVVQRGARDVLKKERPSAHWLASLPTGIGTAAGWLFGIWLSHAVSADPLLVGFSVALVLGCIGSLFGTHWFITQLRPYYRRFIEEHRHEISGAA